VGERLQLPGLFVALPGQPLAAVQHVRLVAVPVTDLPEGVAEVDLRPVQQPEKVGEVHDQSSWPRTVDSAPGPPTVAGIPGTTGALPPTVGAGAYAPAPSASLTSRTAAAL
jgi:hypothetical protein